MSKRKIDKDFVLSDSSVNVYGFRLRTDGLMLDEVLKNPIGYYGHDYGEGVLCLWDDVRVEGDEVLGKPVINMEHPRAERTVKEIEEGFLNAASVGNICLMEYELEDNPADPENPILVGTKWYYKECSLVDSPGNRNAFKLYDKNDQELQLPNLKDSFKNSISNMNQPQFKITPALVALLSLSDGTTQEEFEGKVADLKKRAEDGDQAVKDKGEAERKLADLQDANTKDKVTAILAKGLADKKLTVELSKKLETKFAKDPEGLQDLVDSMTGHQSLTEAIEKAKGGDPSKVKNLADKTWKELDLAGELPNLKENDPDMFFDKFKEWHKKKHKEDKRA